MRDVNKLPDDDIFEDPIDRPLPSKPLPEVDTEFGSLRVYTKQDLVRENEHLDLHGPCPFECSCCVL
jgi:hypothetical protein